MVIECVNGKLAIARRCRSLMTVISCLLAFNVTVLPAFGNAASGRADKIFDRAFLQSIKDLMSYEQVVKIVGVPPVKVAEASFKIPGEKYHWSGRENTSFNIRVISDKIVDANIVTPDGRIISLDISLEGIGEINDPGK
jgi:hypothetical protein